MRESAPARWWGRRCPILVAAERMRGDPAKRAALVFMFGVWLRHRASCSAVEP